MPIDQDAGYSESTPIKQHDFEHVLTTLLIVAHGVMLRGYPHPEFLYFDLNAGPGRLGGVDGSPLIFVRTARRIGLPFRAFFFEKNKESAYQLREALESICPPEDRHRLRIVHGDHSRGVAWKIESELSDLPNDWVYGLAYGDGNGKSDTPIGPLVALAERFPRVDLLLNVTATGYKRARGANPDASYLLDDLRPILKAHRMIREPVSEWQWTMLFLTNWAGAPEFGERGFRRLGSSAGREIADRVNFSKREAQKKTRPLPPSRPTAPTPNTSVTPVSVPSAPLSSSVVAASASGARPPAQPSPIT